MSTTLSNSSDLSTEVAGLKKLVTRLLHLLDQEAGADHAAGPAWRGQLDVQPAAELHAMNQRKLFDHRIAAARMTPDERRLLTTELSLRLAVAITCALERTRS